MIFEQLFDTKSSTYTYIISSGKGREALIIDPVIENTENYINILKLASNLLINLISEKVMAQFTREEIVEKLAAYAEAKEAMESEESISTVTAVHREEDEETEDEPETKTAIAEPEKTVTSKKTTVEEDTAEDALDILSNGFKIRVNSDPVNLNTDVMVYAAFAEAPFVNSEGVPCNAR